MKTSDDRRRARELEEARKAGTIPAERDADGNEINPHIPQFMAQAPWYLNQDQPGLGHQRNLKEQRPVARVTDFKPRGQKAGPAATIYRKGACANCGAMTHKEKVRERWLPYEWSSPQMPLIIRKCPTCVELVGLARYLTLASAMLVGLCGATAQEGCQIHW
eukprot:scaffold76295_cov28-Tisochrysis_lutea.AAC.2